MTACQSIPPHFHRLPVLQGKARPADLTRGLCVGQNERPKLLLPGGRSAAGGLARGPCAGQTSTSATIFSGARRLSMEPLSARPDRKASGSVNRLLWPDSVRHMSVTTAMQGLTAAHHDTRRDNTNTTREPRYAQATGRFRR